MKDLALAALTRAGHVEAAAIEFPPLDIARRVERCVAMARIDEGLGYGTESDEAIRIELEALADRVLELWAPGLSVEAAAQDLLDSHRAALAAARDPGALRTDPRLGWAPAPPDEVLTRAARRLQGPEVVEARRCVAREQAEYGAAAARLRAARKAGGLLARGFGDHDVLHEASAEHEAATEHAELVFAWEVLHRAVDESLASALPPLGVARCALAGAGILRARWTSWDVVMGAPRPASGSRALHRVPSQRPRALLFAALRHLRRAFDAAFEGVASCPGVRPGESAPAAPGGGPYRQAVLRDVPRALPALDAIRADVIARARRHGLDARLGSLLAHGAWLGSISRAKRSDAGTAAAPNEERSRWHRAVAFSVLEAATTSITDARRGIPLLDLREALVTSWAIASTMSAHVRAPDGKLFAWLVGHGELVASLAAAHRVALAIAGEWSDVPALLREAVARPARLVPVRLGARPARGEIVAWLAERARTRGLDRALDRVDAAHAAWRDAIDRYAAAAGAVTLLDELNVFSDSEAEVERNQQSKRRDALAEERVAAHTALSDLLAHVLTDHPGASLVLRIEQACAAAAEVKGVAYELRKGGEGSWGARVDGREATLDAIDTACEDAIATFGVLPSDSEILAGHWQRSADDAAPRPR